MFANVSMWEHAFSFHKDDNYVGYDKNFSFIVELKVYLDYENSKEMGVIFLLLAEEFCYFCADVGVNDCEVNLKLLEGNHFVLIFCPNL